MSDKADAKEDAKHQPIFVKRIIKGGGHHGGQWKVAYADFVTAMMAFFLLLWLLATTTPEQRTGIAEYFTPTVGLKDSKGIGFEGGLTPNEKGHSRTSLSPPGLVAGQIKQGPQPQPPQQQQEDVVPDEQDKSGATALPEGQKAENADDDAAKSKKSKDEEEEQSLKKAAEDVMHVFEQSPELWQLRKNVIVTNTPEGLKIDVVDDPEKPLFVEGTATMTDIGRAMFKAITGVVLHTRNQISIAGHTESVAYPPGATYTLWELSSDRANATRRFLTENLMEPKRVARVVGEADKELLLPKEPENPRNRRISITLLRGTLVVDSSNSSSNRDLLSVPEVDTKAMKPAEPPPPPPKPEKPIEIPETKPGSIFHQKPAADAALDKADAKPADAGKENSDQKDETKSGPGFNVPSDVPPAPPALKPKPKVQVPPPLPPSEPVKLPETAPDTIFNGKKQGDGFSVPADVPNAPAPRPKEDALPAPAEPVQLPPPSDPNSLFAPDKDPAKQ